MNVTLNDRDLTALIVADEAQRRREHYDRRTGRSRRSSRRRGQQQSNTKAGRAWKREIW